jgi:hypothetical protein
MGKKRQASPPIVVVPSAAEQRDLFDLESKRALRPAGLATATELGRQAAVGASLMVEPLDVRPSSEETSISHARTMLGEDAFWLSDAEVLDACRRAETLAQLIVEMFLALRGQERST